jgi:beta-glucosidase
LTRFSPSKGMNTAEIDAAVEMILSAATLEEKVAMMSGKGFFQQYAGSGGRWGADPYQAGAGCDRLGVPALYFTDGPRGVARGNSTCFPVPMARGASWDRDLERRIGEVMAIEARAQGCNLSGAVCVNLLRHPGWGRAQETYGEDPYLVGEMGAALSEGIQTHNVIATVKHFALNSIENARFKIDVRVDPKTLREVYLPHFKRILDAGCASVMSAYNKMNGEYCGQNRDLLTDILRQEWGFEGFVHSDWVMGVYHPYGAAAGLDIENPEPIHFGKKLVSAVEAGAIDPSVVDTACRRILRTLYRFAAAEDPLERYEGALVACPEHCDLALEAAEKSAVLLKNDRSLLPLKKDAKLGLFGRLARIENTGDFGSSRVRPPWVVTPLQGLTDYPGARRVEFGGDEEDISAAAAAAAGMDVAIVVVGFTAEEEGEFIPGDISLGQIELPEAVKAMSNDDAQADGKRRARGGDRIHLSLPATQEKLIRAVAAENPNTIVVIVAGSAVVVRKWVDEVPAVLQTFYSGMAGGTALAKLLFGDVSPSAKLPFTVFRHESEYPHFDPGADSVEYGPLHGYTLAQAENIDPEFCFGYGLSYAAFEYRAFRVWQVRDNVQINISVRNTGDCIADEIVQLYLSRPESAGPAQCLLRGFRRIRLEPGKQTTVRFNLTADDFRVFDPRTSKWSVEPGKYAISVGSDSADAKSRRTEFMYG